MVWFCAAIVGLIALGRLWSRRELAERPTAAGRVLEWASNASGGFYLAHVLVLQLIVQLLASTGLSNNMSWVGTSWILFFGTLAGTSLLVALLLRTPLRFMLTGPNCSDQRHDLRPDYGGLAPARPNRQEVLVS
jgi:surface polysaccharide O-acyltransferase-like enzyme